MSRESDRLLRRIRELIRMTEPTNSPKAVAPAPRSTVRIPTASGDEIEAWSPHASETREALEGNASDTPHAPRR